MKSILTSRTQSILVRKLAPTDRKGARFVAKADAGRIIVSYDHSLNLLDNHAAAAAALIEKLGWTDWPNGQWVGGMLPNGDGAFVWAEDEKEY